VPSDFTDAMSKLLASGYQPPDSWWTISSNIVSLLPKIEMAVGNLETMRASLLTQPPAQKKHSEGDGVATKPQKRKRKTDPKAKEKRAERQEQQKADKRLSEAWAGGMGQYKRKAELAKEKNMEEKDVARALERHRKQLERAGKKRPQKTLQ
jgi:hypothetical protein